MPGTPEGAPSLSYSPRLLGKEERKNLSLLLGFTRKYWLIKQLCCLISIKGIFSEGLEEAFIKSGASFGIVCCFFLPEITRFRKDGVMLNGFKAMEAALYPPTQVVPSEERRKLKF